MKPELRKALEAELYRLNSRIHAIEVLLETHEMDSTAAPRKTGVSTKSKNADGRSLRWQKASSEQRKRWIAAIRAGRKRRPPTRK